jgi:hypothetical protein
VRDNIKEEIVFKGRDRSQIRFSRGDWVEILRGNEAYPAIVTGLPPEASHIAAYHGAVKHEASDDSYLVLYYDFKDKKIRQYFAECVDVFKLLLKLPKEAEDKLQTAFRYFDLQEFTYSDFPLLRRYFKRRPKQLRDFERFSALGKSMDKRRIMYLLIEMYMKYCGLSLGYRTYVYDVGWDVMKLNAAEGHAAEFPQSEAFICAMNRINPNYDSDYYDRWDVCSLSLEDMPSCCMDIVCEYCGDDEKCAAACYGLLVNMLYNSYGSL